MVDAHYIIACSVFKDALNHITADFSAKGLGSPDSPIVIDYLPSNLHLEPIELKARMLAAIKRAKHTGHSITCLYGTCFPGIDGCLGSAGVGRIRCSHCYEVFLGRERYRQLIDDSPGSFFVEKELLLDFDDLCRGPLELDDPMIREMFFTHYSHVVYIRQPRDPDLTEKARLVADFLRLRLRIIDAEYTELKHFLKEILTRSKG